MVKCSRPTWHVIPAAVPSPHDQRAHGLRIDLNGPDESSADPPAATTTEPAAAARQKPLDESYSRGLLTYDTLLDPFPRWSIGNDPFEWHPLNLEEIRNREQEFTRRLAEEAQTDNFDWLAERMLRKPSLP